jgi:hypothetical protein
MTMMGKEFFSPATFASLAAAAIFVYIVVNGIRVFFGFYRKWLVLLVSLIVIGANAFLAEGLFGLQQALLVVGNTFLLALTSVGLNETVAKGAEPPRADEYGAQKRTFFGTWF